MAGPDNIASSSRQKLQVPPRRPFLSSPSQSSQSPAVTSSATPTEASSSVATNVTSASESSRQPPVAKSSTNPLPSSIDLTNLPSLRSALSSYDARQPALEPKFRLVVRQQPNVAQAAGETTKSLKNARAGPIDPPLICELEPATPADAPFLSVLELSLRVHLTEADPPAKLLSKLPSGLDALYGDLDQSPFLAPVTTARVQSLFVFPDLYVRPIGGFRLRVDVIDRSDESVVLLGSIYSNVFTAHSKATFPGVGASSDLMKAIITRGRRLRLVKPPPQAASQPKAASGSSQQQPLPSSPPKKARPNDYSSSDRSPSTEDDQLPSAAIHPGTTKPPPPYLPPDGRRGSTSSLSTRHNSSVTPSSSSSSPATPFLRGEDSFTRPSSDVRPPSHVPHRSRPPPPVLAVDNAGPSTLLPPPQSSLTRWSGASGSAPAPQAGGGASLARQGPPFRHQQWRPLRPSSNMSSLSAYGLKEPGEPSARYSQASDRARLPRPSTAYPPTSSSPVISQRRQSDQYQQQQQQQQQQCPNAAAFGSRPQLPPSSLHLMSSLGVRSTASQSMQSAVSPYSTSPTSLHQETSAHPDARNNMDSSSMIEATQPPLRRASLVSSTYTSSTSSPEAGSTRMTLPPIQHLLQTADQGILPDGPTPSVHGLASSRYPNLHLGPDGPQQDDDRGYGSTASWGPIQSAERYTQQQDSRPRATPFHQQQQQHTQIATAAIPNPSYAPFQPRRRFEPLQPQPPPPHRGYTQSQGQGFSSTPVDFFDPVHSVPSPSPSLHGRTHGRDVVDEKMSSPHPHSAQPPPFPRRRYMDEE